VIISAQDLKHGAQHELPWARGERAVDHLGVKCSQILADKRFKDQFVSEFGEQSIDWAFSSTAIRRARANSSRSTPASPVLKA
jgi:hypothetical protein